MGNMARRMTRRLSRTGSHILPANMSRALVKAYHKRRLFLHVEVEPRTGCNLRCPTCPNSVAERPDAEISIELWDTILSQLAALDFSGTFSPHFFNEPLLDERLPGLLRQVKRRLPRVTVLVYSNFTLMTPALMGELCPYVDRFVVSANEDVSRRAAQRITKELSPAQQSRVQVRRLQENGLYNRAGAIDLPGESLVRVRRCELPRDYLVIDAFGDIHLCYNDFYGDEVFGNVREQRVGDIWFSEAFVDARTSCFLGRRTPNICARCLSSRSS